MQNVNNNKLVKSNKDTFLFIFTGKIISLLFILLFCIEVSNAYSQSQKPNKYRTTPTSLTEGEVKIMLKSMNFFHKVWNDSALGITHNYRLREPAHIPLH